MGTPAARGVGRGALRHQVLEGTGSFLLPPGQASQPEGGGRPLHGSLVKIPLGRKEFATATRNS